MADDLQAAPQDQQAPQPASWDTISADPRFQALPAEKRLLAKESYFSQVIAPRIPKPPAATLPQFGINLEPYAGADQAQHQEARDRTESAYTSFMAYKPVESGWGEFLGQHLPKDIGEVLPTIKDYAKVAGDWFNSSPGGATQARLVQRYLEAPDSLNAEQRAAVAPIAEKYKARKDVSEADLEPLKQLAKEQAQRQAVETPGQRQVSGALQTVPDLVAATAAGTVAGPEAAAPTFSALQAMRAYGDAKVKGMSDEDATAHAAITAGVNGLIFPVAGLAGQKVAAPVSKAVTKAAGKVVGEDLARAAGERAGRYAEQGTTMAGLNVATGTADEAYDQYRAGKIDYTKLAARVGEEAAQGFVSGLVFAGGEHAASAAHSGARGAVRTLAARSAEREMEADQAKQPGAAPAPPESEETVPPGAAPNAANLVDLAGHDEEGPNLTRSDLPPAQEPPAAAPGDSGTEAPPAAAPAPGAPEGAAQPAPAEPPHPNQVRLAALQDDLKAAQSAPAKAVVQKQIDAVAKLEKARQADEAKAAANKAGAAELRALAEKAGADGRPEDQAHYTAQADALEPAAPTLSKKEIVPRGTKPPAVEPKPAETEPEKASPAIKQAPVATVEGETATPATEPKPKAAPAETVNKDGLPVRLGDDVGLTAGMSHDGRTTIHDKARPDSIEATHTDPETGAVSKKPLDLVENDDYHERIEKAELDRGKTYEEAHQVATEAEHARQRQLGFDPNEVETLRKPFYDASAHRARAMGNTTPEVTGEPYQDTREEGMRADGGTPDPRFVLDRDGKKYTDPQHGKLLDSIETVTAKAEDGSHAVLDPYSGMVLARGASRVDADAAAAGMARDKGRKRLRTKLDKEPQLSQQQLREKFKDQHPEARIGAEATAAAKEKAYAIGKGQEQSGDEAQLRGVRPGQDVRQDQGEVRQGEGGQAAGGGGDEGGRQEQAVKPKRHRAVLEDPRLQSPANRAELERMADNAGWAQIGGQMIRSGGGAEMNAHEANNPRYSSTMGDVTGRTSWVPNEPWFSDLQRGADLTHNTDGSATRATVKKALAGEPLTRRETEHIKGMLDEANARETEAAAFHEEGINPTPQDLDDNAAVQHAMSADPDAYERATIQFEHDDAAFMDAVRRINDEHGQKTAEADSRLADEDRQARARDEGGTVQAPGDRPAENAEDSAPVTRGDQRKPEPESDRGAGGSADDEAKPGAEAEGFALERHSDADLADREKAQRDAAEAERKRVADEAAKVKADAEAKDFTLTGSDQPADVAMAGSQKAMFKMGLEGDTPAERATSGEPHSVEDLAARISEQMGRKVTVDKVPPPNRAMRSLVASVKRMTGRDVVFIKTNADGVRGVYIGGKRIFVNVDAAKPHSQIIGHELLHSIRDEQPDIYNRLVADLSGTLSGKAGAKFRDALNAKRAEMGMRALPADKMHEEVVAEVVGDHLADPEFLRDLQKTMEPERYRRLLAHIADFLDKIRAKLTGTPAEMGRQASRFVEDIESARAAVKQALAEAGPERGRAGEREPAFSLDEAEKRADPFYSALVRSTEQMKGAPKSADAAAWKGWLDGAQRRGEFKQEERDWMGLDQFLADHKGPITRKDIQDFVRANQVQLQEVHKGGAGEISDELRQQIGYMYANTMPHDAAGWMEASRSIEDMAQRSQRSGRQDRADQYFRMAEEANRLAENLETDSGKEAGATKYSKWQMPGGENYREHLLTLPPPDWYYHGRKDAPSRAAAEKIFQGGHWQEPNVLAHVRTNDRVGPNGEKILHVEEVQSDWHQKGRKEGYKAEPMPVGNPETYKVAQDEHQWHVTDPASGRTVSPGKGTVSDEADARSYAKRYFDSLAKDQGGSEYTKVPDAPFKTTWPLLAMKRVIRMAAENGYDRVSWTPGEAQADRYDLSKQLSRINLTDNSSGGAGLAKLDGPFDHGQVRAYDKSGKQVIDKHINSEQELADLIGKEAAERILKTQAKQGSSAGLGVRERELRGLDLKVGGEGMKGFYDKILPNEVGKYIKKWGGKVEDAVFPGLTKGVRFDGGEQHGEIAEGTPHGAADEVHAPGFDITPQMREAAVGEGQPMFSLDADENGTGGRVTGIKHATVDEEREERGLPPLMSEARKGFEQSWSEAEQRMAADPGVVQRTIDEMLAKPRPLSDVENAILLRRRVTLHNEYHKAVEVVNDAGTPEAVVKEAALDMARIEDEMNDLDKAMRMSGAAQGRGLAARKMMAKEDSTLASMIQQRRAANLGKQLTPEQRAETEALQKRIADLEKQLAGHQDKADANASKDQGKEVVDALKGKVKAEDAADKTAGRKRAPKKDAGEIVKGMKRDMAAGKPLEDMGSYIQRLCEAFIRQGVDKLDPLVDAVHEVLKQHVAPDLTRRQTMDAISGYGQFSKLNPDAVKATLRDLRGQAQQVAKLADIEAGKPPLKTGMERRTPSDEERRLIQQVNEAKRRLGVVSTDPVAELKSALDSIKTRLKNQISDLDYQINTGKKFIDEKTKVQYDAEAEELKAHRDALKKQFDEIFAKPELTDEQRIELAKKSVQDSIDRYDARIKAKDFIPEKGKPLPPSAELDALKARRDALRAEFETLKNADAMVRQAKLEKMEAQTRARIDELNRRITAGDVGQKPDAESLTSDELDKMRAERDRLTTAYQKMRRDAMTPEQKNAIALKAFRSRIQGMIADTLERTARADYAAKPKRPIVLDEAGQKLRSQYQQAKNDWSRAKLRDRLARRTTSEKAQDAFSKWHRAFLLSSPLTIAKLTSAAAARMLTTPLEEGVGAGLSKVVPGLAARAPREGGLNVQAEAKAAAEGFVKYAKLAKEYIAGRGETDKSTLFGKSHDGGIREKDVATKSIADWFGIIHGALKNPVKEAEFIRSYTKRAAWYARNGVDITSDAIRTQIGMEAWKDAERSIFLQDNKVVDIYNSVLGRLEAPGKDGHADPTGKLIATGLRSLLPIVRVPSNVVAETMQYATGAVTGSVKLGLAMRRGIEKLPPEQADLIMRQLKKGSIGAALLLAGYFNPNMFGGYYQPGEKRRPDDLKAGHVRVGGMDLPPWLVHLPAANVLQMGATIRRVADSLVSKKKSEQKGLAEGTARAIFGLYEDAPFVREMLDLSKVLEAHSLKEGTTAFAGEWAKSVLVPQAVQWVARMMDRDNRGGWNADTVSRKPHTFAEHIKTAVPVLRQQVPKAKGSRPPATDYAKDLLPPSTPQEVAATQ